MQFSKIETNIPIDSEIIKARMKELKFTYSDIEVITDGKISENYLKYILNKSIYIDKKTIEILAGYLNVDISLLIKKDYLLSLNIPFEVNLISNNLYLRNKEDINSFYSIEIRKFRRNNDLKSLVDESHHLFQIISKDDFIFNKDGFVSAFNLISTEFITKKSLANMQFAGLQDNIVDNIYRKIVENSGIYNTQQVILLFLYVLILFDAIFLEEAIASVTQLIPERKTNKADQYYELTYRSDIMRNTLLDFILFKGFKFDNQQITDYGIDDEVIKGIVLMLSACEKCYLHLNGLYPDSEYLNRATFSAILTMLEKIFITIGIELPENYFITELINMNTSRFGIHYNMLKNLFNSLNPPRERRNIELDSFQNGLMTCAMMNSFKHKKA